MASITFECPACGQSLEAPLEMAGDTITCPVETCRKPIRVPSLPAQPTQIQPTPAQVRRPARPQPATGTTGDLSFLVDDVSIRSTPIRDKKNTLTSWQITANGTPLLTLSKQRKKEQAMFMGKTEKHTVTAWFESGAGSFELVPTSQTGIGMLIDGKPVESTLSDPEVMGSQGRAGVWTFAVFLGLKAIIQMFMKLAADDTVTGVFNLFLYGIPAIALVVLGIMFKKIKKGALITALVVGSLETLDFIAGAVMKIVQEATTGNAGNSGVSLLLWGGLRIGALVWIIKGLRAGKPGTVLVPVQNAAARE